MTKKDYYELARIIHNVDMPNEAKLPLIKALADWLKKDSTRFDDVRFLTACCKKD